MNCTLQFDGRVPSDLVAADFDSPNKFFSEKFVLGQGLKFDQALRVLPVAGGSLFDIDVDAQPVEVLISDNSIFNGQVGFRRAELIPASNDGTDPSTQGVKTLHFSVKKDAERPLNLSHEYQLVFLESNDFSTNQFVLKTGTILGQNTADPDTLQVFGNVNQGQLLFSTPFVDGVFHNFALKLDFDQSTTQVFFSAGEDPLKAVTGVLENDLSGQGQFHFGVLKKPVGGQGDITKNGFQEAGINEGIILGGIFEEDSAVGCITLAGKKA
ncbi:44879d5e-d898-4d54-8381-2fd604ce673d [Thermothielavioides terrestris]|uniref:44879d5e-d898-4d54-8381-2fd604ce673d n=1 Tax=Thermothielavioides terrestris TaxID=2587410 RepID=A0A446BBL1_9PEZI|nr:44879d5e-d898-4d54-8381-2fd604ce673d [Thermothielavioides terrestris]